MFKRVLVLVVFLVGVFFWLNHRSPVEDAKKEPVSTTEESRTKNNTNAETEKISEEKSDKTDLTTPKTEESVAKVATVPTKTPTTTKPIVTAKKTITAKPTLPKTAPITETKPETVPTPEIVIPETTTEVKVYLYEWDIDFSQKNIPAGTVNFKVKNSGRFAHDFTISGIGNLGKVMPGETATFSAKLATGSYEIYSERPQDTEKNMKDTITVQ